MITAPGSTWGMLKNLAENDVYFLPNAGAPTNGTSGTGVGVCGPGSIIVDITNGVLYYNNNTKASPTWVPFSLEDVTGDVTISGGVSALNASLLKQTTGTITAADIISTSAGKLGHANGVEMVPAGGAHVVNEFISAVIIMDFGVAAYTGGGNTGVKIGGGGIALSGVLANTVIIQAAADGIWYFNPLAATGIVLSENTGINFVTATAPTNPGTAAGVIRWKCTYRQWATGL